MRQHVIDKVAQFLSFNVPNVNASAMAMQICQIVDTESRIVPAKPFEWNGTLAYKAPNFKEIYPDIHMMELMWDGSDPEWLEVLVWDYQYFYHIRADAEDIWTHKFDNLSEYYKQVVNMHGEYNMLANILRQSMACTKYA